MSYQLYAKNVDLTEPLKEYVALKMKKLVRFMKNSNYCQVDLSKDAHHKKGQVFRAEINLDVEGQVFRAVETGLDIRGALDIARDKMFLQLSKIKEKTDSNKKRSGGRK